MQNSKKNKMYFQTDSPLKNKSPQPQVNVPGFYKKKVQWLLYAEIFDLALHKYCGQFRINYDLKQQRKFT